MIGATQKIREYIERNKIATQPLAQELQISESKLLPGSKEKLFADEFLRLCAYLGVEPERL